MVLSSLALAVGRSDRTASRTAVEASMLPSISYHPIDLADADVYSNRSTTSSRVAAHMEPNMVRESCTSRRFSWLTVIERFRLGK
jgi:hypothetical protein